MTVSNLGIDGAKGYERVPLCPECLEVWQEAPAEKRNLLLARCTKPKGAGWQLF